MQNTKKWKREADRYVDPNETKFQKFVRYLGYYKWPVIGVVCLVAVILVMAFTLVGKADVDMYVFFVCEDEYGFLSEEDNFLDFFSRMNDFIKEYAEDFNGDGEITLGIDTIYISSNEDLLQDTILINQQRINSALAAGTCMCVIGDSAAFEYLSGSSMLQDITYLVDKTYYDGKAYRLNDSAIASDGLGLDGYGPLYIALRSYYGTYAELQAKQSAYFAMSEKMIKILSDPSFDPETDTVPSPVE